MSLKAAMNWTPPRGLERIQTCLESIEVQFTAGEDEFIQFLEAAEVAVLASFCAGSSSSPMAANWIRP